MVRLSGLKQLYLHHNYLDLPPEVLGDEPDVKNKWMESIYNKLMAYYSGRLDTQEKFLLTADWFKSDESINYLRFFDKLGDHRKLVEPAALSHMHVHSSAKENKARDPAEILSYYFRVRIGRRPLNEAKLIYWLALAQWARHL
jgi:hypothetical protein